MAKPRPSDIASKTLHRKLNTPGPFLRGMLVFLALVGFLVAIIHKQLSDAFWNNPLLNGLIFGVLLTGILRAFGQVRPPLSRDPLGQRLPHRRSGPRHLASAGAAGADGDDAARPQGQLSLSTTSMRSIMDSIGGRLDEARDTGRYLVGLLVFLGLLGTFWGLLETMQSVGSAINTLDTKASDSVMMFEELKNGLAAPLKGMGTAFSSSLLGLARIADPRLSRSAVEPRAQPLLQ